MQLKVVFLSIFIPVILSISVYMYKTQRALLSRLTVFTAGFACRNFAMSGVENDFSAAFVTCGSVEEANKLSYKMIDLKIAACVNIIPGITSVYEWQGKVQNDSEVLMMIKTRTSRVDDLSKFIRENHSYEVAEVISMKIHNGNPPYLNWLLKQVQPPSDGSS